MVLEKNVKNKLDWMKNKWESLRGNRRKTNINRYGRKIRWQMRGHTLRHGDEWLWVLTEEMMEGTR